MKNIINSLNRIKKIWIDLIIFVTLNIFFESNIKVDDYMIASILYGAFNGKIDIGNIYINNILQIVLNFLYGRIKLPWFTIIQVLFCFISIVIIDYFWESYLNNAKLIKYVLITFLLYECCIKITFTKTAGIIIIAGFIIIFNSLQKNNLFLTVVGVCYSLWGCLFRNGLLKLCFIAVIFLFYWGYRQTENKKKYIFIFTVACLIIFGGEKISIQIQDNMIANDVGWRYYDERHPANVAVYSYSELPYSIYRHELLDELHVSENDFYLIKYSRMIDSSFFSDDLLTKVADIYSIKDRTIYERLIDVSRNIFNRLFSDTSITIVLLIFIVILPGISIFDKNSLIIYLGNAMLLLGGVGYMIFTGRVQHHVSLSLFVGILISLCILLKDVHLIPQNESLIVLLIVCFIVWNYNYMNLKAYDTAMNESNSILTKEYSQHNKQLLKKITKDKDNMYIMDMNTAKEVFYCFGAYQLPEEGIYSNIYVTNLYLFPQEKEILDKYNINNIAVDSIDNSHVFFCMSEKSDFSDNIRIYIKEHYAQEVELKTVDIIDDIMVMHIEKKY